MEVDEEENNDSISEEEEDSDREPNPKHCFITNLPDQLLLLILSFLPILDAINTSFLSTRWRYLWTLTTNLDFDQRLIVSPTEDFSKSRRLFASFVDRALLLHEGSEINRLRIWFNYDHELYESHLSSWIRFAILRNVKELDLQLEREWEDNDFYFWDMPFLFNPSVFIRDSVRVLKLCLPGLDPTPDMRFGSITTLHLKQIGLTERTIPDLLNFCPHLENLVLDHVGLYMAPLKIYSVKLKTLSIVNSIQMNGSVEIDAPNLLSFTCIRYLADDYLIKDVSSLVEAVIIFSLSNAFFQNWRKIVNALTHVRSLKVQSWWWMQHLQQTGEYSEEILPHKFRYLELETVLSKMELPGIARILRISPNLETMVLESDMVDQMVYMADNNASEESYTGDYLEKVFTGSPLYLKKLKITSFLATDNEIELVKYLLKYGVALEKIILVPYKTGLVSVSPEHLAERFQELQAFPRSSKDAEILLL
ncbi:putative F-box protein At1g49610 isoform X1 [Tasmannia lanceolata]|uniref:putative F-box protein At1g49610 isoform X1 n=1 Tax=Tasmannia lanceolata TaxID=3420 RepID=UPI00406494AD